MRHPDVEELALYSGGDLPWWESVQVGLHVRHCRACAQEVAGFRAASVELRAGAGELPADLDWDHLAAEMRANIHLGVTVGAITPERPVPGLARPMAAGWTWQLGVVSAALAFVGLTGWMLEMQRPLDRPAAQVFLETRPDGLALRAHGSAMTLLNPEKTPVTTTVNWDGGARASYIDSETGQVTIHHVSAE